MLVACSATSTGDPDDGKVEYGHWGVETKWISATVSPGDNFYHYVNEGWTEQAEFPAGMTFYNAPWHVQLQINDTIEGMIADIAETENLTGSREDRLSDFYQSFLHREAIESNGIAPLKTDIDRIMRLRTHEDIARFMGDVRASSIFHLVVQPPVSMQGNNILTIAQYRTTGLGLPSQAHYNSQDGNYPQQRIAYEEYIARLFALASIDGSADRARDVLKLETQMAALMWDFARLRDAGASFTTIDVEELGDIAPGFPWKAFLAERGLSDLQTINLGIGAIVETADAFRSFSVAEWQSFFLFHWINSHADLLPRDFGQAKFSFFEQTLFGATEQKPLDKRAYDFVQWNIGDEVGRLYAETFLPEAHERAIEEMVGYIRDSFHKKLLDADWMDDETRRTAQIKLDKIIIEIGYPRAGPDWSQLQTAHDDPIGNRARALALNWDYNRNRIGKPISRWGGWNMNAHHIGMGYHQQYNKIFMTAGALSPPFFDPNADLAVNYGAVGQTIAHEFGHALDDQGSGFDENGALRDWWSAATRSDYESRTQALIAQFSEYETLPGVSLQSEQMIGEIVGDLVGTSVAYAAYLEHANANGVDISDVMDGMSGPQRFFLSAAQQSRAIATDDVLRYQALNASHPPAEFRINGILRNFTPWYRAFSITDTDALYLEPVDRIELW